MPPFSREILISPFSNSAIRDWPVGHFAALVGLLLERLEEEVRVTIVGTLGQRLRANEIVRPYPAPRVANSCGRISWAEVIERLRRSACVIGNNSGVAHLGAALGVPTVCVFGGSHQRLEWRPQGANVVLVSRAIGCSPCQLDHGADSPYDKACLRLIEPETVAGAAMLAMSRHAAASGATAERKHGRLVS